MVARGHSHEHLRGPNLVSILSHCSSEIGMPHAPSPSLDDLEVRKECNSPKSEYKRPTKPTEKPRRGNFTTEQNSLQYTSASSWVQPTSMPQCRFWNAQVMNSICQLRFSIMESKSHSIPHIPQERTRFSSVAARFWPCGRMARQRARRTTSHPAS